MITAFIWEKYLQIKGCVAKALSVSGTPWVYDNSFCALNP